MNTKLQKLYNLYKETELKIRKEINKLSQCDECNCDEQEEILLVKDNGNSDLGVERICGNCGGAIWDREI